MGTPKILDETINHEYKGYALQARHAVFYPSTDSIFVLHIWKDEESIGSADRTFLDATDALNYGIDWVNETISKDDETVLDWLENV